jgi:uracil-DNA glycosylase
MTTNLVLDARQRAMLAEMGVRVWLPTSEVTVTRTPTAVSALTALAAQPPTEAPTAALMALPVRREPPLRLPVMDEVRYVIGNLPADAGSFDVIVLGEPCQGTADALLANMLKIFGSAAPRIFIAHMIASHNEAVSLQDQLATIPAKLVLALGPHAAKALLDKAAEGIPFSKLRGTVHAPSIIVTYHPQQLLRQSAAKASCWQDMRLALRTLAKP